MFHCVKGRVILLQEGELVISGDEKFTYFSELQKGGHEFFSDIEPVTKRIFHFSRL